MDIDQNKEHQRFMKAAISEARKGMMLEHGGPFGAVLVKNGKIIGSGHNEVILQKDPTAHAEINAIRKACRELNDYILEGCVIYCSSEPCPMCLGAIYWSRIHTIFYACKKEDAHKIGFDDRFFYQEIELPIEQRKVPCHQLMREEALVNFQMWDQLPDKPTY